MLTSAMQIVPLKTSGTQSRVCSLCPIFPKVFQSPTTEVFPEVAIVPFVKSPTTGSILFYLFTIALQHHI